MGSSPLAMGKGELPTFGLEGGAFCWERENPSWEEKIKNWEGGWKHSESRARGAEKESKGKAKGGKGAMVSRAHTP